LVPILELKNISKSYYGNPVLNGVSFSVKPGEIRGIIGENGAGKSTMMNIIFGMPVIHDTGGFTGEVLVDGRGVNIKSPMEAMEKGIGMVHQEFMLIPELAIYENIKLNREITKPNLLSKVSKKLEILNVDKMRADSRAALKKVGISIDEWLPVAGLPVGHMQFIEIAREVDHENLELLVFDEPTAVLTEIEAKRLLKTMKHLAKDLNIGILFISHRLDEIEEICDTLTILRDGELVGNFNRGDLTTAEMAEHMVGHKVSIEVKEHKQRDTDRDETILELKDFHVNMPGENVKGIDLKVRRGEILGVGGLAGQGKLGIANGIAGLSDSTGKAILNDKEIELNQPLKSIENKITFLSEDRRGTGLLLDESIEHNISFTACYTQGQFLQKGIFEIFKLQCPKRVSEYANNMIEELDIRCTNRRQHVRRLSGGNQQKVCMSRVIATQPDILMVSEPTRGVDIGAKKLILDKLIELNELGMTIIVTSSELVELRAISDRIIIIAEGRVAGEFLPKASDADIGLAMAS